MSATVQDNDSSETIASVRISGLTDVGGLGLVGSWLMVLAIRLA